jgi:subtilisin family serine protease
MRFKHLLTAFLFFIISVNLFSDNINSSGSVKYWIIFKDKGIYKPSDKITKGSETYILAMNTLKEKAIKRRLKVLTEENLVDFQDLPVYEDYITDVKNLEIKIIAKSKWLNGISAYLTENDLKKVLELKCVSNLKILDKSIKQEFESISPVLPEYRFPTLILYNDTITYKFNYGKSLPQLNQINVPLLHNMNITGKGVLIASLDDGFEWKKHEALKNLNVLDEYDFINNDKNTEIEENSKYPDIQSQGGHGTATLSSACGFKEGKLLGPAFGSDIILAKTEYVASETPMEEDFWLEAAEWAEAYGADIITSSLIYKAFDNPYEMNSYEYKNYDGKTAITTLAAARASYLGIVVCNAVGNYFQLKVPTLGSPSDGDSIISVGAVNNKGDLAFFSSNGPTSDGRIKPDVCAQGVSVFVAVKKSTSNNESTYEYSDGTSFSTPITAGSCALILSAHPELTPLQVRECLRNTASNSQNPDNLFGWGIINVFKAITYWGITFSNLPEFVENDDNVMISIWVASNKKIDKNSVKLYYNSNGNKFNTYQLEPEKIIDENNSGRYIIKFKSTEFSKTNKLFFSAKDSGGIEKFYPGDLR